MRFPTHPPHPSSAPSGLERHRAPVAEVRRGACREVLTHADRFQHPSEGAFRRWLFTTALRKLSNRRDHLLAERRDVGRNVHGQEAEGSLLQAYARIATPSQHASVREQLERVETAMQALSDDERSVVVLARIVGLSQAEIAEELGVTKGAVRMRLHRALAKLAVTLED
ncbi:MAG: sigma-70 family RNA polymerase sigma factor [bacterium]|nr:sigma-70 family RNA polymerase sigma factor [bacterium]